MNFPSLPPIPSWLKWLGLAVLIILALDNPRVTSWLGRWFGRPSGSSYTPPPAIVS